MSKRSPSSSSAVVVIAGLIVFSAFFVGFLYGMMPDHKHALRPAGYGPSIAEIVSQPGIVRINNENIQSRLQVIPSEPVAPPVAAVSVSTVVSQTASNVFHSGGPLKEVSSLHEPASLETTIPPIVAAWRAAKLDWHSLLPAHNSKWERFGTPQHEGKLRMLVGKEVQATDFLTRFHESGLAAKFGHDHGPLQAYSGCDLFSGGCMIHDEKGCDSNQLCTWSADMQLCTEQSKNKYDNKGTSCPNPKMMKDGQWQHADSKSCKAWVNQPSVILSLDSETQSMFYHWWASWSDVINAWQSRLHSNREVHFFVDTINDPMFFQYFGLISNFCWRRKMNFEGVCFCDTHVESMSQADHLGAQSVVQMMNFLQLNDVKPPSDRVKVGIISRRRKRFILNEYDLVDATRKLGYECELLPLETMTLYEQMRMLRSLDVLVGIHGSALDNSVFLTRSSVMVQLLPYKVEHRVTFESSCVRAGMKYMEWQLKDRSKAYFHWDLLDMANSEKLKHSTKEQILAAGQVVADNRETTMFWINQVSCCCCQGYFRSVLKAFLDNVQDIIVPIDEWTTLIKRAVQNSPAKQRVRNI
jgi:hypothetical protein